MNEFIFRFFFFIRMSGVEFMIVVKPHGKAERGKKVKIEMCSVDENQRPCTQIGRWYSRNS